MMNKITIIKKTNNMIYTFNKKQLKFVRINWFNTIITYIGIIVIMLIGLSWSIPSNKKLTESEILVLVAKENKFNDEKLIKMINKLNFSFPYIVYAQTLIETNRFTSNIFIENHNLFGMKQALVRINTARGIQNNHAYYDSWVESVYDYALYSATYLSNIKTEDEYLDYLSQSYADDKQYVNKLRNIITKEGLKAKFN